MALSCKTQLEVITQLLPVRPVLSRDRGATLRLFVYMSVCVCVEGGEGGRGEGAH